MDNVEFFEIQVIRGCDFPATLKEAEAGNKHCKDFMHGFAQWSGKVMAPGGGPPACFSCEVVVTPDNFGGIAFAKPTCSKEAAVGAFCLDCQSKGRDVLADEFSERIRNAVECVSVH